MISLSLSLSQVYDSMFELELELLIWMAQEMLGVEYFDRVFLNWVWYCGSRHCELRSPFTPTCLFFFFIYFFYQLRPIYFDVTEYFQLKIIFDFWLVCKISSLNSDGGNLPRQTLAATVNEVRVKSLYKAQTQNII